MERILGMLSICLFPLTLFFFVDDVDSSSRALITPLLFVTLPIVLKMMMFFNKSTNRLGVKLARILPERMEKFTVSLLDTAFAYRDSPSNLSGAFILSVFFQASGLFASFMIMNSLIDISFVHCLFVIPYLWIVSMIPISLGGLGVREGSLIALLVQLGYPEDLALSVSILMLIHLIIQGFVGWIVYMQKGLQMSALTNLNTNSGR